MIDVPYRRGGVQIELKQATPCQQQQLGGSSGSSPTQSTTYSPPTWTANQYPGAVQTATDIANTGFQQYGGMPAGAAPFTADQYAAQDLTAQTAMNGSPDTNAGRGAFMNIANGSAANNPWLGSGPTNAAIQSNADLMTKAYQNGGAAQNDAAAARAGAFGSSGYQLNADQGQSQLAGQIGNMANQYQLQNQQAGAQDYRTGVNQQLQGATGAIGGQQLDFNAANSLNNSGNNQQAYTNQLLGINQGNFNNMVNYPQQTLNNYLSSIGQASGQYGSNQLFGAQGSTGAQVAGGALGLLGAYNQLSSP